LHLKIKPIIETGSPEFEKFLEVLGQKIRLRGWDKYRGGLDIKGKQRKFTNSSCKGFFILLYIALYFAASSYVTMRLLDTSQKKFMNQLIPEDFINIVILI
jgi:hypothetical protein